MTREDAIKVLNMVEAHGLADEAKRMAIEALEQEPCEDAISRQATLEPYKVLNDTDTLCVALIRANIMQQPPVTPQKKTGRWIKRESGIVLFECSVCKDGYIDQPTCMGKPMFKYCPSCGEKMEVEE